MPDSFSIQMEGWSEDVSLGQYRSGILHSPFSTLLGQLQPTSFSPKNIYDSCRESTNASILAQELDSISLTANSLQNPTPNRGASISPDQEVSRGKRRLSLLSFDS